MTTITITAETIAKLESAGFNRWIKGGMDRLYIDAETLGLEVKVSRSGKALSEGIWCGSEVYKQEATEILASKVWIDVATGELHVVSDFTPHYGEATVEEAATAYVESILAPEPETEEATEEAETETIQLDAESTLNGNYINAPLRSCKPVDQPTGERVTVELDGQTYERTVYERVIWRNSGRHTVSARFVIIDGTNYLV